VAPAEKLSGILPALERHWGYRELRPHQGEAMLAVLEGRDSLVVLPTGGGKSLCYQAPAVARGQLALVISPLISLMKDQVDGLTACGVPAAYLNSTVPPDVQRQVLADAAAGRYRLLYMAPERLVGEGRERVRAELRRLGVRYVAIDEAHCISHWGHDFRPEYRQLGRLRDELAAVSLHAYTATATPRVRADVVEQLGLREAEVIVGSFERPNLVYRVIRRAGGRAQARQVISRHQGEGGIVYCITRREVEQLAEYLRGAGVRALPYHAGLDDDTRRRNQEAFIREQVEVIVATVAFGMGIDRSNVRFVVHAGAPRSLEHYQQEAGRAGRDGLPAECVLLFSWADVESWRRILRHSDQLDDGAETLLRGIVSYASRVRCRHRALVEYFGQQRGPGGCGACDVCLGELEAIDEPQVVAQKILSCVLRVRERWGVSHVVEVLRGIADDRVAAAGHHRLSTFGLLADVPAAELRGHVEQLVEHGFLLQTGDRFPVLAVSEAGWKVLRGELPVQLYRQRQPPRGRLARRAARGDAASWEGVDRELFEALRELRLEVATERGVPPYVVLHDATLRELARHRPRTRDELRGIHGIGERRAADLGPRLLAVVAAHRGG